MILAEKIAKLRKQNGWSQEELAEKLDEARKEGAKKVLEKNRIVEEKFKAIPHNDC